MTIAYPLPESSLTGIAVYCGSSMGNHPAYAWAAQSLGKALAKANRRLIYGGGDKGLMGAVARSHLSAGGKATGITLKVFMSAGGERDKAPEKAADTSELAGTPKWEADVQTIVVDSLHARKLLMARKSSGFVALPGGFGTYDEVIEATTWTQIGIHNKPVVILNVLGIYNGLKLQIQSAIDAGFVESHNDSLIVFIDGPEDRNDHESFDWGRAALTALDEWHNKRSDTPRPTYDWGTSN